MNSGSGLKGFIQFQAGLFTFTPSIGDAGKYKLKVVLTDDTGLSDDFSFDLVVNEYVEDVEVDVEIEAENTAVFEWDNPVLKAIDYTSEENLKVNRIKIDNYGVLTLKFSEKIMQIQETQYFSNSSNPVMTLKLTRDGNELPDLLIDWQLVNVTTSELNVQLDWEDTRLISSGSMLDRLEVTIHMNGMFIA